MDHVKVFRDLFESMANYRKIVLLLFFFFKLSGYFERMWMLKKLQYFILFRILLKVYYWNKLKSLNYIKNEKKTIIGKVLNK